MTHEVTGHDSKVYLCRIDNGFAWSKPSEPMPHALLSRALGKGKSHKWATTQFADGTQSVVNEKSLRCVDDAGRRSMKMPSGQTPGEGFATEDGVKGKRVTFGATTFGTQTGEHTASDTKIRKN